MEEEPTIYEKMAQEKVKVACAQIGVLNFYDPSNEEARFQRVYDVSHHVIFRDQSERALEQIDKVIEEFREEVKQYRENNPELEAKDLKLRERISEMESLLNSK